MKVKKDFSYEKRIKGVIYDNDALIKVQKAFFIMDGNPLIVKNPLQ